MFFKKRLAIAEQESREVKPIIYVLLFIGYSSGKIDATGLVELLEVGSVMFR